LISACSRVTGYPHRYVQHALEALADRVWEAMQKDAVVLVGAMPRPWHRASGPLISVFRAP
jgi:cytochrome P450/NADPH-cytochrome P450 reductase